MSDPTKKNPNSRMDVGTKSKPRGHDPLHTSAKKIKNMEARHQLWRLGIVRDWMLDSNQKKLVNIIDTTEDKVTTVLSSRQIGKSFALMTYAIEFCLKNPDCLVIFVTKTQKMAKGIATDKAKLILASCPDELKPEWREREFSFFFHNGARIQLYGAEGGQSDRIRGKTVHLILIDEAGFIDIDMREFISSVLVPSTITTNGKVCAITTPPEERDHSFYYYIDIAQQKGLLRDRTFTIHDNPRLDKRSLDAIIESCGGVDTDVFKREYLCHLGTVNSSQVVPEFDELTEFDIKSDEGAMPEIYDAYVSADIGFKDFTAVLFAYYDYKRGYVVIMDEVVVKGETTDVIAQMIKYKESEHWTGSDGKLIKPWKRVMDHNPLLQADLSNIYKIDFENAEKTGKDMAIDDMRKKIVRREIRIHPRCVNLLHELRSAQWTLSGKDFKRLKNGSHCDTLMSLVYLLRSVDYSRNPYPKEHSWDPNKVYRNKQKSNNYEELKKEVNPFMAHMARTMGKTKR